MKYWKRVDADGKTTTVESYSHALQVDGAVEIDKAEFNAYIAALAKPEAKLTLEQRVEAIEAWISAQT